MPDQTNSKENTVVVAQTAPQTPQSYEDCILILESMEKETDPTNILGGIKKLRTFFSSRLAKRKNERTDGGGQAVKNAIASGRNFKPYEPRPIAAVEATSSPWK